MPIVSVFRRFGFGIIISRCTFQTAVIHVYDYRFPFGCRSFIVNGCKFVATTERPITNTRYAVRDRYLLKTMARLKRFPTDTCYAVRNYYFRQVEARYERPLADSFYAVAYRYFFKTGAPNERIIADTFYATTYRYFLKAAANRKRKKSPLRSLTHGISALGYFDYGFFGRELLL